MGLSVPIQWKGVVLQEMFKNKWSFALWIICGMDLRLAMSFLWLRLIVLRNVLRHTIHNYSKECYRGHQALKSVAQLDDPFATSCPYICACSSQTLCVRNWMRLWRTQICCLECICINVPCKVVCSCNPNIVTLPHGVVLTSLGCCVFFVWFRCFCCLLFLVSVLFVVVFFCCCCHSFGGVLDPFVIFPWASGICLLWLWLAVSVLLFFR